VLSEEEKRQMEVPIEGKNGEKRKLEMIIGRQKLKKSFQYEVKWKNLDHRHNTWLPREKLMEAGFGKLVQEHDDLEASREGSGSRDLSFKVSVSSFSTLIYLMICASSQFFYFFFIWTLFQHPTALD
jgi:elongation factor 3